MKEGILTLITELLTIYYYVLLVRFFLSFASEQIKEHSLSVWIYKLTHPVTSFGRKLIPDQEVAGVKLNLSLLLVLLFYSKLIALVTYVLSFVLI